MIPWIPWWAFVAALFAAQFVWEWRRCSRSHLREQRLASLREVDEQMRERDAIIQSLLWNRHGVVTEAHWVTPKGYAGSAVWE